MHIMSMVIFYHGVNSQVEDETQSMIAPSLSSHALMQLNNQQEETEEQGFPDGILRPKSIQLDYQKPLHPEDQDWSKSEECDWCYEAQPNI